MSSTFCFEGQAQNTMAVPMLQANVPQILGFGQPTATCTGTSITYSAGTYTFVEAGIYVVDVTTWNTLPLLPVPTAITLSAQATDATGILAPVTCQMNINILGPQECDARFVVSAAAGATLKLQASSTALGPVRVGGSIVVEKM